MLFDLGPACSWRDPFPVRATPFLAEVPPNREMFAHSRTLKGGSAVGIVTVSAAGVEVAQKVLTEIQSAILPLAPYLYTLRWVIIAIALIDIVGIGHGSTSRAQAASGAKAGQNRTIGNASAGATAGRLGERRLDALQIRDLCAHFRQVRFGPLLDFGAGS